MMSLIRSRSTGELVLSTGSRRSPSPSPSSIFGSGCAEAEPGSQSTNFSPISPCEPTLQLASVFHGVKSAVVDPERDGGLLVGRHVEVRDHAHGDAGDLHVLAGTSVEALSKIARTK